MRLPADLAPYDENRNERDPKLQRISEPQPGLVVLHRFVWRKRCWCFGHVMRGFSFAQSFGFHSLFLSLCGDVHGGSEEGSISTYHVSVTQALACKLLLTILLD